VSNCLPVARNRAYRSRWLWLPAAAVSLVAQGAGVLTYEATRPVPKPLLTLRITDGAAEWDFSGIDAKPAAKTSLTVVAGEKDKIELATTSGTILPQSGQQVILPDRPQSVVVLITTPDGAQWRKRVDVKPQKDIQLAATYSPSCG
jgi:hypothetical protein